MAQLNKLREFQFYKEMLSVNIGETVAYTEQKNFYQVAAAINKPEIKKIITNKNLKKAVKNLEKYKQENDYINSHIKKYEWVNSEYVSGCWEKERWIDLFRQALLAKQAPREKLNELILNQQDLIAEKQKVIKELNPPKEVLHAIKSLEEIIAQRDWAKGYLTRSLISYHKLIDEIADRLKLKREDLYNLSYTEVIDWFVYGKILSKNEINERKRNGFALIIKKGKLEVISGKADIQKVIEREGILGPFETILAKPFFKGLSASRGVAMGVARVLEDASGISEFKEGEIIVTYMTTMEFTPIFRKAKAVVTDEGGMSCHAAIISREFKIPCIVGSKIATRVIKTGDKIEVDANKGIVKIIKEKL